MTAHLELMIKLPNGLVSEQLHESRALDQIADHARLVAHHGHQVEWVVITTSERIPKWPAEKYPDQSPQGTS